MLEFISDYKVQGAISMKKNLLAVILIVMLFGLTACGGQKSGGSKTILASIAFM